MEMPRDIEGLDRVWEIWAVNSRPLFNWKEAEILEQGPISQKSPFVGGGDCLYPPREGVHQDQKVLKTFGCGHVGKVKSPFGSRERTSGLVNKKRGLQ